MWSLIFFCYLHGMIYVNTWLSKESLKQLRNYLFHFLSAHLHVYITFWLHFLFINRGKKTHNVKFTLLTNFSAYTTLLLNIYSLFYSRYLECLHFAWLKLCTRCTANLHSSLLTHPQPLVLISNFCFYEFEYCSYFYAGNHAVLVIWWLTYLM